MDGARSRSPPLKTLAAMALIMTALVWDRRADRARPERAADAGRPLGRLQAALHQRRGTADRRFGRQCQPQRRPGLCDAARRLRRRPRDFRQALGLDLGQSGNPLRRSRRLALASAGPAERRRQEQRDRRRSADRLGPGRGRRDLERAALRRASAARIARAVAAPRDLSLDLRARRYRPASTVSAPRTARTGRSSICPTGYFPPSTRWRAFRPKVDWARLREAGLALIDAAQFGPRAPSERLDLAQIRRSGRGGLSQALRLRRRARPALSRLGRAAAKRRGWRG